VSAGTSTDELAPYEAIMAHAELELELAGRGDVEGLAALGSRWEELTADLPGTPPVSAGTLLERARMIHERTRVDLARIRDGLLVQCATASRAKRAATGYGRELRRLPQLDRNA
jgi:hypothetical protein